MSRTNQPLIDKDKIHNPSMEVCQIGAEVAYHWNQNKKSKQYL